VEHVGPVGLGVADADADAACAEGGPALAGAAAQAVHPLVAEVKFNREVEQFKAQSARMRARGILLVEVAAPTVTVAFATPHIRPQGIVTAVRFDYSDYDLLPPSLTFVDAFSGERLAADQLLTWMVRGIQQPMPQIPGLPEGAPGAQPMLVTQQPLIQNHDGGWPFLCLPGVREYHEHPGHSGDPWELYRTTGAGSLVRLVDTIHKYAVEPISDWGVQILHRVGFSIGQLPT
jgi:hypothetical protein